MTGLRWTEEQLAAHKRRSPTYPAMRCESCGGECERKGATQRYCEPCSGAKDAERKATWAKRNPRSTEDAVAAQKRMAGRRDDRGAQISREHRVSISQAYTEPDLVWLSRVAVPFLYSASKNAIYSSRAGGHVVLRRESKQIRSAITLALKRSLQGQEIRHNKVWIDIFVQKPDHRGDAVNVVDLVCDAVKDAMPVDDRWFSLRRVDWQVVKHADPMMYIGVGQEDVPDAAICSSCGRALATSMFWRNKSNLRGLHRNCKDCCRSPKQRAEPGAEPRVDVLVASIAEPEPERLQAQQSDLLAETADEDVFA